MTFALFSDVRETSTSTGTGDLVLAGAVASYFTFAHRYADADTFYYGIKQGANRESGLGRFNSGANSISRVAVYESSNSDAAVNFAAGTKDVYVTLPGSQLTGLPMRARLASSRTLFVRTAPATISFTNGSPNVAWAAHGLQANDLVYVDVLPGRTGGVTITNASPAIVTWPSNHGFAAGQPIQFASTGYLPPGIIAGTTYYVIAAGLTATTFEFSATVGGAGVNTSKLTFTAANDGGGNILFTASGNHNLVVGQTVSFANSGGALPGSISAGTAYYVIAAGLTATAFEVSATPVGSAVAFSTAGSGTNTLEQVGGTTSVNFGSAATHYVNKTGAMPSFSLLGGALVAGTAYYVGTVVDGNTITLSSTLNNANPVGTATVATGSPQYTAATGNDANGGLVQTRAGAFATIQAAVDFIEKNYDFTGQNVTINVADGTYRAGVGVGTWTGGGTLTFMGNSAYPSNVAIALTASGATSGNCFYLQTGTPPGEVFINGFTLSSTVGAGIWAGITCVAAPTNIEFGTCSGNHILAQSGGTIIYIGTFIIAGTSSFHVHVNGEGGIINGQNNPASTVVILNVPSFAEWAFAKNTGSMQLPNTTFIGTSTGAKYVIASNGVMDTAGKGANYFPGNSAGSTATGGQYI